MRANAPVWTPASCGQAQDHYQDHYETAAACAAMLAWKYPGLSDDWDAPSTAAPSPALTAESICSPWASPHWGLAAAPLACQIDISALGYGCPDHFVLPDADSASDPDLAVPASEIAGDSDSFSEGFALSGLEDLKSSVAGLFADLGVRASPEVSSEGATALALQSVAPRPGTEASAGAVLAPPPGLEARTPCQADVAASMTVAELHAKLLQASEKSHAVAKMNVIAGEGKIEPNDEDDEAIADSDGDDDEIAEAGPPCKLPANCTTVMLRNIPNKYTQDMVVDRIHMDGFKGDLDFIYLPVDFKHKCNVGYVFVNFRSTEACERFANMYHRARTSYKLPGFRSKKICEVSPARHQGCEENVRRLQHSPVMVQLAERPEWLPRVFDERGSMLDFPVPDAASMPTLSRTVRMGRLSRRAVMQ